jgi:hypothetical protein
MKAATAIIALFALSTQAAQEPPRLLVVDVDGKYGFIDRSGQFVIPLLFDFAWGFSEGLASVWLGKEAGYIDAIGRFAIPPQFSYARWFRDGLAGVELDGNWGFVTRDGSLAWLSSLCMRRSKTFPRG